MSNKPKIPRAKALEVANEIYKLLLPWCERCKVVGSLRRARPMVSDVEFLIVGKVITRKMDLLEYEQCNAALLAIDELVKDNVIAPRPNCNGITAWGEKNRLAIHVTSEVPIDFFMATPESWWNMLVCRTGGSISNTRLAQAYKQKGLRWHPYGEGYTNLKGNSFPNLSEEDVFKNAGLRYIEPDKRP